MLFNENKTEDRRIRKTKRAIQNSLYALLRKKELQEIRVKELAEGADINRGTFYRYYGDVEDILRESEQDFLEQIRQIFDSQEKEADPRPVKALYELCKNHAELLEIVFSEERDPKFIISLWQLLKRKLAWKLEAECGNDRDEAEDWGGFLAGGCIAVLKEWIAKDWRQPTEEVAAKTERCLFLMMPEQRQL